MPRFCTVLFFFQNTIESELWALFLFYLYFLSLLKIHHQKGNQSV